MDFFDDQKAFSHNFFLATGVGTMRAALETVHSSLVKNRPRDVRDCVAWARFCFEDLFSASIKQLLYSCPADMVDSNGTPFWSGTKRCPSPIEFDSENPLHLDFVYHGACLRAENYGFSTAEMTPESVKEIVDNIVVPEFKPKQGVKVRNLIPKRF